MFKSATQRHTVPRLGLYPTNQQIFFCGFNLRVHNYEVQAWRWVLSVNQNKQFLPIRRLIWQSPSGSHQEVILSKFLEWPLELQYNPIHDIADLAKLPQMHTYIHRCTHSTHSLEQELSAIIADKTTETWHRLTREEEDEGNEISMQTERQTHTHTLSPADTHSHAQTGYTHMHTDEFISGLNS